MTQVRRSFTIHSLTAAAGAVVLCVTTPVFSADGEAPIRRMGDNMPADYAIDLNDVPAFIQTPEEAQRYVLPDTTQQRQLEKLLTELAVRPGDKYALQELEVLLNDVLVQADQMLRYRKLNEAEHLLRAVRHVNPDKIGLRERMKRLRLKRAEPWQYTVHVDDQQLKAERANHRGPRNLTLPDSGQQARLDQVLDGLKKNPGSSRQMTRLNVLLTEILSDAEVLAARGELETAARMIDVVANINPEKSGLRNAQRTVERVRSVENWEAKAERAMARDRLIAPPRDNAFYFYQQMLVTDSRNIVALDGLARIQAAMIRYANDAALNLDFITADDYLAWAERTGSDPQAVVAARHRIDTFRVVHAERVESRIRAAIARGDFELAEFSLIDLMTVGGQEPTITALQQEIREVRPALQ